MMDFPLLGSVEPIRPIKSVDELIEIVGQTIEAVESAEQIERILDGISRLCDQKLSDFARKTVPFMQRITKL